MMRRLTKNQKDVPLGLVNSNSAASAVVPQFHAKKRPSLQGGPQLSPASSPKKPSAPKQAPALTQVVGYHNLKIVDIANNFAVGSSRENIGKVYAAASALHIRYRPVSNAGNASLFAANAAMVSSWTPSAKPSSVVPFRPRIGGSSVLKSMFGRSPLEGTGLVMNPSRMPLMPTPRAPALRLAA